MSSSSQTPVIKDFIERELQTSAPGLSQAIRERLGKIARAFLDNETSMNYSMSAFAECGCPPTLITKLAHLKAVGNDPLPAPQVESTTPAPEFRQQATRKKAAIWSQEEDLRLIAAVSRYGHHDWKMISAFVGSGRTSSQCNQRWTRALNPAITHTPWSAEEDQKLLSLVNQMGIGGWRKIASLLNGRTDLQCRHRYLQLQRNREVFIPETRPEVDVEHTSNDMVDIPDPHHKNPMSISYYLNSASLSRDSDISSSMLPPLIIKKPQLA